jgi:cytochrome o ubiquinol oxidase subunit 2
MVVFQPKGIIAAEEKNLIIIATLLMLIVVIPVIILTLSFAWKYRASNPKAKYTPDWDHNPLLEVIWWSIPCVIILILAVITWRTSHDLDPYKPLEVVAKPLTIEVVALDWKWLFIYPEQNIATINYVQIPVQRPIVFKITADAPMNALWIPQLGGQIYAMAGMQAKLHLIANEPGEYRGVSANFSGPGFSDMKFITHANSEESFKRWVKLVQKSPNRLTAEEYVQLAQPSENDPIKYYSYVENNLYQAIMKKFMQPTQPGTVNTAVMPGMAHNSMQAQH